MVELALVIALAMGLSRTVQEGVVTAVISLAGGAVLLWMGWGLLRMPSQRLQSELAAAGAPKERAAGAPDAAAL